MCTGIDILSSKIQAQELALNGVGAKGIEVIRDPLGVRIGNNSDIHTVGPLTITGSSGNTVKNTTTDVNFARGIYVNSSDIKSDRGMITLSGTGGSGNQVKDSHGILLRNTNIRGPRIKLMGIGGKATDVSAPNAPSLEMYNYYDQQYGNSYWNSGIFISDNNKIVSNPVNDDYGSTIILGDSSNNNGDIELVGYGGNGVDYIGGVVVADNPSLIDSGGDLTISGTSGTENDFVLDSQGVSHRGQGGGGGNSTFKAVGKITIHGRGGSGETINDGVGIHIHSVNITAKDLEIKGYGGRAEKIATLTWGTGLFESTINLDGTLDIYGEGGYAKTSRTDSIASMNGGVIIFGNTFNMPNSSSVKIAGESGEGGQSAIGTSLIFNDWIVGGNTSIFGKGGDGNDVNTSAGIAIDRDVWSIQGDLILDGIGGQGVKTTANYGVKLAALSLVADSILIKGVGGNSTNTDESQANYGAGFLFSDIQAKSGNITVNGNGGTGGYDNTGVKILASNLKALNGIMDIDGVGGAGKIVQENNGVGLVDAEVDNLYNLIFFPEIGVAERWAMLYENFDFSKFDSFIDSSNKTRYGNKIEAASIDIQGTGGIPTNKNQSLKNFGLTMNDTKLISSGTMNLSGQGGDGGQSIAGINIKDATLTSSGDTSIIGIAGEGDRVVKGEGIIFDSSILTVSSANQIELTGTGSGVDTDNQIKK